MLLLAAVSSLVALVLAYVLAHGFTPFAFERYTRLVGQVFNPVVSLVFVLKTGALALAVSVVPIGAALHAREAGLAGLELQGLVRMFMVVLAIEVGITFSSSQAVPNRTAKAPPAARIQPALPSSPTTGPLIFAGPEGG